MQKETSDWIVGIDVGGTFTDLCAYERQTGRSLHHKLMSTPQNPAEAILQGISELLGMHGIDGMTVSRIAHGTTVATNALIQDRGGKVALVVTEGFRDLLEIGRQVRPRIYDFQTDAPAPLVPRERRYEAAERMTRGGKVLRSLSETEIIRIVNDIAATDVDACAICLLFSFEDPSHEQAIAAALRKRLPQLYISVSSEVQPEFREYERLSTTVLNAYLQPVMSAYIERFEVQAGRLAPQARLGINQSSGGLISVARARNFPVRTALSGPAAGVAGALDIARACGASNVITLDIGGTSSDICLIRDLKASMVHERKIEGYPVRMPAVDINAVGAGGGSIGWIDAAGLMKVGPQSAGSFPGPACYGHGGQDATVSDANLVLGRLSPGGLLGGNMPLRQAAAQAAVSRLAQRASLSTLNTALGIIDIAVANMVRGIRSISTERGHDPRQYVLLAFGGAGPLHACAVARQLGIGKVLIPSHPGLLCARGLIVSDQREHFVRTIHLNLEDIDAESMRPIRQDLQRQSHAWFDDEGIPDADRDIEIGYDMRYVGQNFEIHLPLQSVEEHSADIGYLHGEFARAHEQAYGFFNDNAPIEITGVRLTAIGRHATHFASENNAGAIDATRPSTQREVWFDRVSARLTPIYDRGDLVCGDKLEGPCIIEQLDSTTVVFPGDTVKVDAQLNLLISLLPPVTANLSVDAS